MLESVEVGTVAEIAAKEKINPSYVSRVLRLTLLAPDIIEAIMDGQQPAELSVHVLRKGFPVEQEKLEWDHECLCVCVRENAFAGSRNSSGGRNRRNMME